MTYEYVPYDPDHYMTNLRREQGGQRLVWDGDASSASLVVQTPYGEGAVNRMEAEIVPALNRAQLSDGGSFVEVIRGVWAACTPPGTRRIALHGRASTYTVFAVRHAGDALMVHEPKFQAMVKPSCDLPLELAVRVRRHTEPSGFLGRRQRETGFWEVVFMGDVADVKDTTGLVYGFDSMPGLEIPIAPPALANGCIYIRSDEHPRFRTKASGLKLTDEGVTT